ncbi:hypothetical protein F66182_285 [Fusarium sp. NRRL 66182]|nr:hypothetical protein F66182_285 [Fusarium sp. NRRL 66182]
MAIEQFFLGVFVIVLLLYITRLNSLLKSTPNEVQGLSSEPWTPELLRKTYDVLEETPIETNDQLPPKLNRRYIVTGGNGLVGGYIVLQLLARGTSPRNIRILDIRKTERGDMLAYPATQVEFVQTDIASRPSVNEAFAQPWDPSVAHLPLTVFHTAAVIIPSARSRFLYEFPEAVNIGGTNNVLAASRAAGADVFSATSSASISVRPVKAFVAPWTTLPQNYWQFLDEKDFFRPLGCREEYFGNYAATKAVAERLVCAENEASFRTGCIRPANGVYGHPMDNPVGGLLTQETNPTLPFLQRRLPEVRGHVKRLQPGLFSICTHLIASDADARKPASEGGLGYRGALTTLQGVVMEIMEWNREHMSELDGGQKKAYTNSVTLAEKMQGFGAHMPIRRGDS